MWDLKTNLLTLLHSLYLITNTHAHTHSHTHNDINTSSHTYEATVDREAKHNSVGNFVVSSTVTLRPVHLFDCKEVKFMQYVSYFFLYIHSYIPFYCTKTTISEIVVG